MQNTSPHPLAYIVIGLLSIMLVLQLLVQPVNWVEVPLLGLESSRFHQFELMALAFQPHTLLSEPWRILSAHVVHLDWPHALTNMLAFTAACIIFAALLSAGRLIVILLVGAVGACLIHALGEAQQSFVGFSALTHAIVAFAAIQISTSGQHRGAAAIKIRPLVGYVMLVAIVIKSMIEFLQPAGVAHWLGADVAVYAHLGGLLGGAVVALGYRLNQHLR